jgi:hypothetical protein
MIVVLPHATIGQKVSRKEIKGKKSKTSVVAAKKKSTSLKKQPVTHKIVAKKSIQKPFKAKKSAAKKKVIPVYPAYNYGRKHEEPIIELPQESIQTISVETRIEQPAPSRIQEFPIIQEPVSLMHGVIDADEPTVAIPIRVIDDFGNRALEQESASVQVNVMDQLPDYYLNQTLETAGNHEVTAETASIARNSIPFAEIYPEILTRLEDETAEIVINGKSKPHRSIFSKIGYGFLAIFTKFAKRNYLKLHERAMRKNQVGI